MGADGSDTMRQSSESEIEARKPSIRISTDAYSAEDNAMDKIKVRDGLSDAATFP